MKKLTLRVCALISFLVQSNKGLAQGFDLGIKTGVSIFQNTGSTVEENYRALPYGGAYLGFRGEHLGIAAEAIFTQTTIIVGDNFNDLFSGYFQAGKQQIKNSKFSFTELSVPVVLEFKLFDGVWGQVGPQFTKVVAMEDKSDVLKDIGNVYKDSYASTVIGLKVNLPFNLNANARFIQGFTNRNNTEVPDHWVTQHMQIGLGFGLR